MPDQKELNREHLTVEGAHTLLTELRHQAETLIIEHRTLVGFNEVLELLQTLKAEMQERVATYPNNSEWQKAMERFEECESFFAIGEIWRTLTMAEKDHLHKAETETVDPVSL